MNYHWNWSVFLDDSPQGDGTYLQTLLAGLEWTVATALGAWTLAFLVGSLVGIARTLPADTPVAKSAARLGDGYIELFRNVPLLVQLFIWFYVVPEWLPHAAGVWVKQLSQGPFYTAVLGIGLYMSSRVAVQVTAGIRSLPSGQRLAGTAIGLTTAQTYRYVLLPLTYRVLFPPLTSEFLNTVKNTSVALTIGLIELTASARAMQEFSFQVFESFIAAAILYLLLNGGVTITMRLIERRLVVPGFNAGR